MSERGPGYKPRISGRLRLQSTGRQNAFPYAGTYRALLVAIAAPISSLRQINDILTIGSLGELELRIIAAATALSLVATPSYAAPNLVVFGLQIGQEQIRYRNGVPTITLDGEHGGVQVSSLPFDHGGLSFSLGVFNDSPTPANIDISSLAILIEGQPVKVLSRQELERAAKRRAGWAQFGTALVGGLAAAGTANQQDHYRATTYTPRGSYTTVISAPSAGRDERAAGIIVGTGLAIDSIRDRLDRTLSNLGAETLQLSTVEPGESYGGRIVTAKVKPKKLPARIDLTVSWNGESYAFAFQLAKAGSPLPPFNFPTKAPVDVLSTNPEVKPIDEPVTVT